MVYEDSLYRDLLKAKRRIYFASWSLSDDFIIKRGPTGNTLLADFCRSALAANPNLEIYFLIWDWGTFLVMMGGAAAAPLLGMWGPMLAAPIPSHVLPHSARFCTPPTAGRLHFAFHPNLIAGSHHQKFVLCDLGPEDSASLHCLGLNLNNTYWDVR
jgi:phosphatidylserine/phosphatidylglycerophosphate/cardiolipin synthase-like enzyme